MTRSHHLFDLVAQRRTRYKIGAVAAAAVALGATPASAQYGTDPALPPLPPLPAVQGEATPPAATVAPPPPSAPPAPARATTPPPVAPPPSSGVAGVTGSGSASRANQPGVAGAVGSGDVVPATGTAGAVRDTGVGGPTVRVVSSERAEPVALSGEDLPFTGANIALFVVLGAGLLVLGLGVRRRSGVRTAKP